MAPPPSTQHIFFETAAAAGAEAGSRQVRHSASTTSSAPARLPGYQAPSQNARHPPPFHPHRGLQDRRPPRLLFRGGPRPAPPPPPAAPSPLPTQRAATGPPSTKTASTRAPPLRLALAPMLATAAFPFSTFPPTPPPASTPPASPLRSAPPTMPRTRTFSGARTMCCAW